MLTSATGCGDPVFANKKLAQDIADNFNINYPYFEHWVEYVEVPPIVVFIESEK